MPQIQVIKPCDDFSVGIWATRETLAELEKLCQERGIPFPEGKAKRQRELATEYLLLYELLGKVPKILHDCHGAPSLEADDRRVSISHTIGYVAVAIAKQDIVMGIDVEQFRDIAIRVRMKFLSEKEQSQISENDVWANVMAWTIKEAVYKAAAKPGLDFANDIVICNNGKAWCAGYDYEVMTHSFEDAALTIVRRKDI